MEHKNEDNYLMRNGKKIKEEEGGGCLLGTAKKCRITPQKGCIFLITSLILLFICVIQVLIIFAYANTNMERNRPAMSFTAGQCGPSKEELIELGENSTYEFLERLSDDNWELHTVFEDGDKSYIHKDGDQYKITGKIAASPEDILDIIFSGIVKCNETFKDYDFCKILKQIDERTDIVYQKTHGLGPISPRDFITLRHFRRIASDNYVFASKSIEYDETGIERKNDPVAVRGYMGMFGWHLKGNPDEFDITDFETMTDSNIKMIKFPFWDGFMVTAFYDYVKELKKAVESKGGARK